MAHDPIPLSRQSLPVRAEPVEALPLHLSMCDVQAVKSKQPWEWRPIVRSRALEWLCFVGGGFFAILFLGGIATHGARAAAIWPFAVPVIGGLFALGLYNRRRRFREIERQTFQL